MTKETKLRLARAGLFCGVSAAVAFGVGAPAAFAQTAPTENKTASSSEPDAGSDIVVTALKRSASIQSVPLSISATTGEALANAGVTDIRGLLQTTPSLNIIDGGVGQTRLVIRGIYSAGESTVGLYYDEAPVSGSVGSSSDAGASTPLAKLFDVERVEGLRGPQGTLYGSGSMGGTLRIIFNKPTFTTEGAVDGEISGTQGGKLGYIVQGMANVPLVDDKLAVRVVGFDQKVGGYVDYPALGQKDVTTSYARGGRAMIRAKPTENLTIDGMVLYQNAYGLDPKWDGGASAYQYTGRTHLPFNDDLTLYNLTANWDLGPATLTAIASDMHRKQKNYGNEVSDYLGGLLNSNPTCAAFTPGSGGSCTPAQQTAFNSYVNGFIPSAIIDYQTTNNPSGEIRLSSNGRHFIDWTIGGFYSLRKTNTTLQIQGTNTVGDLDPGKVYYDREINDRLRQLAGFGEASAHLTDKLTLTFGARYFDYSRTVGGSLPIGLNLVGAAVTPFSERKSSEHGWVTKSGLSYQFTPQILFYATASQGFRPGGVNQAVNIPANLAAYNSDSLWNYEAGLKTSWFGNKLIFNMDVYRIDWTNMQVLGRSTTSAFQFITNAGAARVQGIEMNTTLRPVRGLVIDGNATYSSAKLVQDQTTPGVAGPGVKGDRIPYVPKVTLGGSAQYTFPLNDKLSGMLRVDESYQGASYSEFRPTNTFRHKLPSYSLTNARVGIESPDGGWGAYLFVSNIFNNTAITYGGASGLTGGKFIVTSAMPRTYGLNLRTHF